MSRLRALGHQFFLAPTSVIAPCATGHLPELSLTISPLDFSLTSPTFKGWKLLYCHLSHQETRILLLKCVIDDFNHLIKASLGIDELTICIAKRAPLLTTTSITLTTTTISRLLGIEWHSATLALLHLLSFRPCLIYGVLMSFFSNLMIASASRTKPPASNLMTPTSSRPLNSGCPASPHSIGLKGSIASKLSTSADSE